MTRRVSFRQVKRKQKRSMAAADPPVLNSATEPVIATDLAGKVVFWNLAAERMYGWQWHEAVGRPIAELIVPDSQQGEAAKIMEKLCQGKSWSGEFKLRRRDGSEFIAIVTDHPMHDHHGNLVGI